MLMGLLRTVLPDASWWLEALAPWDGRAQHWVDLPVGVAAVVSIALLLTAVALPTLGLRLPRWTWWLPVVPTPLVGLLRPLWSPMTFVGLPATDGAPLAAPVRVLALTTLLAACTLVAAVLAPRRGSRGPRRPGGSVVLLGSCALLVAGAVSGLDPAMVGLPVGLALLATVGASGVARARGVQTPWVGLGVTTAGVGLMTALGVYGLGVGAPANQPEVTDVAFALDRLRLALPGLGLALVSMAAVAGWATGARGSGRTWLAPALVLSALSLPLARALDATTVPGAVDAARALGERLPLVGARDMAPFGRSTGLHGPSGRGSGLPLVLGPVGQVPSDVTLPLPDRQRLLVVPGDAPAGVLDRPWFERGGRLEVLVRPGTLNWTDHGPQITHPQPRLLTVVLDVDRPCVGMSCPRTGGWCGTGGPSPRTLRIHDYNTVDDLLQACVATPYGPTCRVTVSYPRQTSAPPGFQTARGPTRLGRPLGR